LREPLADAVVMIGVTADAPARLAILRAHCIGQAGNTALIHSALANGTVLKRVGIVPGCHGRPFDDLSWWLVNGATARCGRAGWSRG